MPYYKVFPEVIIARVLQDLFDWFGIIEWRVFEQALSLSQPQFLPK